MYFTYLYYDNYIFYRYYTLRVYYITDLQYYGLSKYINSNSNKMQ